MSDIHPALWVKQISKFIVAYHDGAGLFEDIQVRDVKNEVQDWATENQDGIRRFATLLGKIVKIAKSSASKKFEVYCPGMNRLEIRTQFGDGVHALPADLAEYWEKTKVKVVPAQSDSFDGLEHSDGGISLDEKYDLSSDLGDSSSEPDYTACSAHDCGYCGKCTY